MSEVTIVNVAPQYAPALAELQRICFPSLADHELMVEKHFIKHCEVFSDGEFVALVDGKVVGLGSGFFVYFDFDHTEHTFKQMIAEGFYTNHEPDGDYYYGADISVHPEFRGLGIGRKLYDVRKQFVIDTNRRGIVAGGVLPGYPAHRARLTVPEYVAKVVAGELTDPTLTMQLRNDFVVRGMLENYIEDSDSDNWASLIYWENPHFQADADMPTMPSRQSEQ